MKKNRKYLIYRVEHKILKSSENGFFEGPYRGTHTMDHWAKKDHNGSKRTPRPSQDGLIGFSEKMVFGFKSMDQVKDWFSRSELKNLKQLDFVVGVYKVSFKKIKRGKKQLVFEPPQRQSILPLP